MNRRSDAPDLDVLVVGKGPAGLAAAAECAARGLRTAVVGPPGPVVWPAEYGAWTTELDTLDLRRLSACEWPQTVVDAGLGERRVLPNGYARVDKDALLALLSARCESGGVRWLDGSVVGVEHGARGSEVLCADGWRLSARVVVDSSGHRSALVQRPSSPEPGFQTAFGLTFPLERSPFPPHQAVLMDWSDSAPAPDDPFPRVPSFLYAMPLEGDLFFAEETVLVARPAVPAEVLEKRLHRRLASLGIFPESVASREICWIPMGGALPHLGQRVVGFGGAAAMVHPATGYLLTRVLESAPGLAHALAEGLGAEGAEPARTAHSAWLALWPADLRRRRALFCFGMEALLGMDAASTRAFFSDFFRLPEEEWQGYLLDRLSAPRLASVMSRLFARSSAAQRAALARPMLGRPGAVLGSTLLRSLVS